MASYTIFDVLVAALAGIASGAGFGLAVAAWNRRGTPQRNTEQPDWRRYAEHYQRRLHGVEAENKILAQRIHNQRAEIVRLEAARTEAERPLRAFDELIAETEADPVRGPRLREARERLKREGIGPITVVDLDWLPTDDARKKELRNDD